MNEVVDTSYNTSSYQSSNSGFQNISALQIRLDTQPILENIELFLKGVKIVTYNDGNGNFTTRQEETKYKKANEQGIQAILSYLTAIFNSQVVQGNFTEERFEYFIMEKNIELTELIIDNAYNWEIKEDDANLIIDTIVSMIYPFMSRTINNKERDSYSNTIKSVESNTINPPKSSFPLFK